MRIDNSHHLHKQKMRSACPSFHTQAEANGHGPGFAPAFDVPVDSALSLMRGRGLSLSARGMFFCALLRTLDIGAPHPPDDRNAASMLAKDVRAYRSALAECIEARCLQRLQDGRVSALMADECRPTKRRRRRLPRARIGDATRESVLAKTGGVCVYCAVALTLDTSEPTSYEPDHVLPVALGGTDDIANLVPSCLSCNRKKRARTALTFMGGADDR